MSIRSILSAGLMLSMVLAAGEVTLAQRSSQPLAVTTAIIAAGGGAGGGSFSSVRAFSHMFGSDTLQSEMASLRNSMGADNVDNFVRVFDFAFIDGWKRAGEDDVKMPAATSDTGAALATDTIHAGVGPNGAFRLATMMDALWTPRVHEQIHGDIVAKYGNDAVANFERVGNQFFSDLAQSLHQPTASPSLPKSDPAL